MAAIDVLVSPVCSSSSAPLSRQIRVSAACSTSTSGSSRRSAFLKCGHGEGVEIPALSRSWSNSKGGKEHHGRSRGRRRGLEISAIDAAQEFDYETMKLTELERKSKLKVGIVGFGNFGQFLAARFVKQGHHVLAHSRSDYGDIAKKSGVTYFRDADDFCEEHPEVVVLCTSILSTEAVLLSLPVQRLKRSTLFVDVLSVKEFPRNLLLQVLPSEFDVLCTHPMFGPESGRGSWGGLPFVYEKVRVREGSRTERCSKFLNMFESEGCRMVQMSCQEHDRHAAGSQFITHTVGRVLGSLGLESTPINTRGYESLLKLIISEKSNRSLGYRVTDSGGMVPLETVFGSLVDNTYSDSFDLYYGLFLYNVNATEELVRLERAFDIVKSQLFDKLHSVLRQQMLKSDTFSKISAPGPPPPALTGLSVDLSGTRFGRSNNAASPQSQEDTRTQVQSRAVSDPD